MNGPPLRRNALLANLPEQELLRIHDHAKVIESSVREPVYQPGSPITEVYFPLSSVFSVVAVADPDGQAVVEVATVGPEGMVGLPLFLGATTSPHAAFCQVPGMTARLHADGLRQTLTDDGALHQRLNRFVQATIVQIAQNVVCNSTHSVEQRAARWLLTTQDRVGQENFPLTHEFLAQMLSVRRPTVSETASRLQSQGLIRYTRGQITITNRQALENIACHCYTIVKAEFDDLSRSD
jgi:CRP-like cAMP-binding protein